MGMWEGQIKEQKKCPNELSLFGWISILFRWMLLMLGQIRILSDILQFAQTIILKIVRERERWGVRDVSASLTISYLLSVY